MNAKVTDTLTIWQIDDDGKKAIVKMSSTRKVDEEKDKTLIEHGIAKNGYVSTYWSFVQFVGKAYNKLKKDEVKEKTRITNLTIKLQQEPYWDFNNSQVGYLKNPKIVVFDFEYPEIKGAHNIDKGPVVAEPAKDETPQPETKEEYPF